MTRQLNNINGSSPEVGVLSTEPRVEIWRNFLSPDQIAHVLDQRDLSRALDMKRDSLKLLFLNLQEGAPVGQQITPGTISAAGDAVFEQIESKVADWTGAGLHPHETDLMLTFSSSDGANVRTGDYLRFRPRTDEVHVDTSGDYLQCSTVMIFLADGPVDGGTVFPCLPSVASAAKDALPLAESMAATCRAAGEELLEQPPFDPTGLPKRDEVRFTKWGRERKTGQPLSPALRSVWEAATQACDGDGEALRVVPEAGMALMWQHRDCAQPAWAAELAAGDLSGSDYRTFHARCLHETGLRATLQKFKRPRMHALVEHGRGPQHTAPT